mmetsp:Transcript_25896/g.64115  ORF Transcript_25896/g.64115 Transcript_25896/m.64115 type:complete len:264 (-) Transcript_25896:33-824(-)
MPHEISHAGWLRLLVRRQEQKREAPISQHLRCHLLLRLLLRAGGSRGRGWCRRLWLWLWLRLLRSGRREVLTLTGGSRDDLALARSLVLDSAGLGLIVQRLLEQLLLLRLVDVLHQHTLVLELVTLRLQVEGVVQVLVELLLLAVLLEKAAQHTHAADPLDLDRHPRLLGAPTLTMPHMPSLALRLSPCVGASPRVHFLRLLNDKAVLDQLADVLARIGHGDLVDLIRVEPDLSLATFEHGRRQALLQKQRHSHDPGPWSTKR